MTDTDFHTVRRRVRAGQTPPELVDELRSIARRLARRRLLPPSFAPYGSWDDEAAEEVFAAWYADRLVGEGQLLALLDRASDLASLRRLAARSLRQHILNAQDRSQARNLFGRVVALLNDETSTFSRVQDATRPQDRWYALRGTDPDPWSGPERVLIAHAWGLGDFAVIRYRAGAAKLSPVLDAEELRRFTMGLLERTAAALTPGLIMRVLSERFALGDVPAEPLADETPGGIPADSDLLLRDTASALLDELTPRQLEVLRLGTDKVADIAATTGCSVGTVVNEQRRIGQLITRGSGDDAERATLLNVMVDLLYVIGDA